MRTARRGLETYALRDYHFFLLACAKRAGDGFFFLCTVVRRLEERHGGPERLGSTARVCGRSINRPG